MQEADARADAAAAATSKAAQEAAQAAIEAALGESGSAAEGTAAECAGLQRSVEAAGRAGAYWKARAERAEARTQVRDLTLLHSLLCWESILLLFGVLCYGSMMGSVAWSLRDALAPTGKPGLSERKCARRCELNQAWTYILRITPGFESTLDSL